MLRLSNIEKSYGEQLLFHKVTLAFGAGEKVGIVGANACGKSTLLKIIAGISEPDEGHVAKIGNSSLSYFEQEHKVDCGELSGGQEARLRLARVLKEKSDIVLLDEPTNNLDAPALAWLEAELERAASICLIVSHDRQFLDNLTTRTIEIDPVTSKITDYSGNYSWYRTRKKQLEANQLRQYKERQERIKQLTADIRDTKNQACRTENSTVNDYLRGRSKKVAAKAKARETRLLRMIAQESIEKPQVAERMRFTVAGRANHCSPLIEMKDVQFRYRDRTILSGVNIHLSGSQRVLIEGANGSGKTTLLRLLLGELQTERGTVWRKDNLKICYLPQKPESASDISLLDYFHARTADAQMHFSNEGEVRTFLHRFQFSRGDVFKQVGRLSPGERTKLSFAVFMAHQPDILIFDEPTNHLDLSSRECLEDALQSFRSALIVVSHDRYFLKSINTDMRWVLNNGQVQTHL